MVAAGVVVLLGGASVFTLVTGWPAGNPNWFRLSVGADKSVYRAGEAVRISGRACSTSLWWFKEGASGGGGVHISWRIVDEAGRTVADTSHAVSTLELGLQIWWPLACRSWSAEWDLRYWNQPDMPRSFAGPARGEIVPVGKYRVEAKWRVSVWQEQPLVPSSFGPAAHTRLSDEFIVEAS